MELGLAWGRRTWKVPVPLWVVCAGIMGHTGGGAVCGGLRGIVVDGWTMMQGMKEDRPVDGWIES